MCDIPYFDTIVKDPLHDLMVQALPCCIQTQSFHYCNDMQEHDHCDEILAHCALSTSSPIQND